MNEVVCLPAYKVVVYADAYVGRGPEGLVCRVYRDAVACGDSKSPARLLLYYLGDVFRYDLRLCIYVYPVEARLVARDLRPVTGIFVHFRLSWKVDVYRVAFWFGSRDWYRHAYRVARMFIYVVRHVVRDGVPDYEGVYPLAFLQDRLRFGRVPSEPEAQNEGGHEYDVEYRSFLL